MDQSWIARILEPLNLNLQDDKMYEVRRHGKKFKIFERKTNKYLATCQNKSDAQELVEKKARKGGYQKITDEDLKELGFANAAELGAALADGKTSLSKLKPLKPWFALAPPVHGFKRSTKKLYGQKGILGSNKELDTIVRRMI